MNKSAKVVSSVICIRDEAGLNYLAKAAVGTGFMGLPQSIKANAEMGGLHRN
jgi:LPS sulfotransferase NodH